MKINDGLLNATLARARDIPWCIPGQEGEYILSLIYTPNNLENGRIVPQLEFGRYDKGQSKWWVRTAVATTGGGIESFDHNIPYLPDFMKEILEYMTDALGIDEVSYQARIDQFVLTSTWMTFCLMITVHTCDAEARCQEVLTWLSDKLPEVEVSIDSLRM